MVTFENISLNMNQTNFGEQLRNIVEKITNILKWQKRLIEKMFFEFYYYYQIILYYPLNSARPRKSK